MAGTAGTDSLKSSPRQIDRGYPTRRIASALVFDLLAELSAQPDYRGCAFARASADASASDKVKSAVSESRAFILEKFTDLCRLAGAADPVLLAKQLVLLYDGATTSAYMDGNRNAAATARALAVQVLVLHNLTAKKY